MPQPRRTRSAIYDPIYQQMLTRLRAARRQAGLTQEEASTALGRSANFVSRCETGERRIDPVDLLRFAKLYRRDIVWFLPKMR